MASLDVLRGLAVAGMVLVNVGGGLPGLQHARWHGCTVADLVFPVFLFVMGASMAQTAPPSTAKVVRRAAVLFGLGLLLNGLPRFDMAEIHVMGVLQRIAVCYLLAAFALRRLPARRVAPFVAAVLIAYWALLTRVPPPGAAHATLTPDGTIASVVDRAVLGARHVYANGPLDPEGVLSTATATCTVLLGWMAGRHIATPRVLVRWGLAGVAVGLAWHPLFPLNKWLWTGSFVLFTAGVAALALAALARADEARWTHWPEVLGRNAIVVFVLAELAGMVLGHGPASAVGLLVGLTAVAEAMWRRRRFVTV